jgi:hypothetical protein
MDDHMTRRKPIPPLYSDDSEPLFTHRDSGDDFPRYTLEDNPSPVTPEPRRFALQDPSPSEELSGLPSFPGMARFSEEDRAVLSPISERPERQSSKASSTARSGSTVVGQPIQNASLFGQVMQSVEPSYPVQPEWNQSAHFQQQQQQLPYTAGHHGTMISGLFSLYEN